MGLQIDLLIMLLCVIKIWIAYQINSMHAMKLIA